MYSPPTPPPQKNHKTKYLQIFYNIHTVFFVYALPDVTCTFWFLKLILREKIFEKDFIILKFNSLVLKLRCIYNVLLRDFINLNTKLSTNDFMQQLMTIYRGNLIPKTHVSCITFLFLNNLLGDQSHVAYLKKYDTHFLSSIKTCYVCYLLETN